MDEAARLLPVADIHDALTPDRPYRLGIPHAEAMDILWADARSKLSRIAIEVLADRAA